MITTMTAPKDIMKHDEAMNFYSESVKIMQKSGIPFLVGGTFAVNAYTGINRPTKDIDFFCKPGDYPKLLNIFAENGYKTQVLDERWLAKVTKDKYYFDFIFSSPNGAATMNDNWLKESRTAKMLGHEVRLVPPTELVMLKTFVKSRTKYDGADVAHLILKKHKDIDWKRLLMYMEQYWEILFITMLNFRFIYPSERESIPRWLIDELDLRFHNQLALPTQKKKICRGRLLSKHDYETDIKEWGFEDLIA